MGGKTKVYSASRWFIYTLEKIVFFHSPFPVVHDGKSVMIPARTVIVTQFSGSVLTALTVAIKAKIEG